MTNDTITRFGTVWVAVTYNCNNRCKWCYAASNLSEYRDRELNLKMEDGIVSLLRDLKVRDIKLLGGEPTLYRNIVGFVGKLADIGPKLTIVTNGRRFADYSFAKAVRESGVSYLSFSIEGYNEETHDAETNSKGSFKELLAGIENAERLGFVIITNTTMTNTNKNHLEKIVDLVADKSGIISFNICSPWLRGKSDMSDVLSPKEGARQFERVYRYAANRGLNAKLTTPTPVCNFSEDILEKLQKDNFAGGVCSMLAGQNFVVDYNGDVLPCTLFSGFPLFNIFKNGNVISSKEFIEVYNAENGLGRRLRERLKRFPSKKCTNKCREFCTGGCPLFWTKYHPDEEISGKE